MKFTAKIKDIARTLTGSLTITLESPRLEAEAAAELLDIDSLGLYVTAKMPVWLIRKLLHRMSAGF